MKFYKLMPILLVSALCTATTTPASAQFGFGSVVYDPTAVGQLITQVNNQIQMLNNMVTQLQQGQAMLNPLGSNILPGLSGLMQNTQTLVNNLNNIGTTGTSLTSALERAISDRLLQPVRRQPTSGQAFRHADPNPLGNGEFGSDAEPDRW